VPKSAHFTFRSIESIMSVAVKNLTIRYILSTWKSIPVPFLSKILNIIRYGVANYCETLLEHQDTSQAFSVKKVPTPIE
jgi:hypothetical protein